MSDPSAGEPPAGLLQMGASVSVNDDTRRVIEAEAKEVEAVCTTLASEESKEVLVGQELAKNRKRQENEISTMRRGAMENFESVQMNEGCLVQIKGTLQHEIRPKVENPDPNSNKENPPLDHSTAFQEAIVAKSERSNKLAEFGEEQMRTAEERKHNVEELVAKRMQITQKAREENLKIRLANAKLKTLEGEDSLNEETKRLHTLREQHTATLERCNQLRDVVAKETQAMDQIKSENATKEAKIKEAIEASKAKKQQELDECQALEVQLEAIRSKHVLLTERLVEGKDLIAQRQKEEARCAEIRAERSALFVEKTEVEVTVAQHDKKLKGVKIKLQEVIAKRNQLESLKAESDKKVAEDQRKITEKEAENMALSQQLETSKTAFDHKLQALTEELAEVKKKSAEDEVKMIAIAEESKELEKEEESLRVEIDQERASFEQKCAEMESKVREEEETNDAYEGKIQKQMEKKKAMTMQEVKAAVRKCKVLKIAVKALDAAKKAESALAELKSQESQNEVVKAK